MFQRTEIIGHLGKEPEMRYTPQGQPVTNFSVATTNTYTKNGDKIKETTWFRVSVWGAMAEACKQYLEKGSLVFVAGRIQVDKKTGNPRVYENKKSGDWSSTLEINASEVKFLSGSGNGKAVRHEEDDEELPEYMRD
jgi:single-strand DNA-binding protein